MNKKTLNEILSVSWRVATTSNESVKGWPVRFAKDGERFARSFIRIGFASLQYDRPVRRFERRASFLQRAWDRFRKTTQSDAISADRRAESCRNEMFAEKNGRKIYERVYRYSTGEDKRVKQSGRPRETAAATEPSVFHDSVSAAVRALRLRLEENYRKAYPDLADIIHLLLDQEEVRAWQLSPFPHLLFPDLVQGRIERLNLRTPLNGDCYRPIPSCGFASA